jgi:hypothetical protein
VVAVADEGPPTADAVPALHLDGTAAPIVDLVSPPPWSELPVIRHGSGGARTDVICGYLDVEDPLFDPSLGALPPIFVVRPIGAARTWVESSLAYVLEATAGGDAGSGILTRLPAIVLAEVLRIHVSTRPSGRPRLAGGVARSSARTGPRRAAPDAGT